MRRLTLCALIGLVPTVAGAQDLSSKVTNHDAPVSGLAGSDGDDEGHGVALDGNGAAFVVGWQDGLPDHGDDALLYKIAPGGASTEWTVVVDGGAVDGYTRTNSTDRFHGVTVDDADNVDVAGELSGSLLDGWNSAWYVGEYDPAGLWVWSDTFQDSTASLVQAAHAVAVDPLDQDVVAGGWSFRSASIAGRWVFRSYVGTTGLISAGPFGLDAGTEVWAPDQAWDLVVDDLGFVYAVGAVNVDGSTDPSNRNYDWHVRKYDAAFTLQWERTWSGLANQDDVARSVALDGDGNIIVAGYTNVGSNNTDRADYDWLVIKYDGLTGDPLWEVVWDSLGGGASEKAFALDLDWQGDAFVGGSWQDPGGLSTWRLAELSGYDGAELDALTWTAEGELLAVDERDGQVALTGWEQGAADRDVVTRILDEDSDVDGVGNFADGCPEDGDKVEPLVCGCGDSEDDSDGDTYQDCVDECPALAEKWDDEGVCGCDEPDTDRDQDGAEDCIDNCPDDPEKTELGVCGCGLPDTDSDGDGVLGCDDACSNTPPGTPVDDAGCPTDDTTNPTAGTGSSGTDGGSGGSGGCGCDATSTGGSWLLALIGLAAVRRRRRA